MKTSKLVVGVVAVAALAGCTSSSPTPDATDVGGPVTLTFWSNLTVPQQADVIQAQIDECLTDMPDVTVEFETVAIDAVYPRLLTAYLDEDAPNIINTVEAAIAFAQARGQLVPVDDVIDEIGRDEFNSSHLNVMSAEDQTWGVPDWALHDAVYYRKDLFEQAGLEVPTSWDELLDAAEQLTQGSRYGFAIPLGTSSEVAAQTFFQFLYSAGVYVFDPETGEYVFGDHLDEAADALAFLVEMYEKVSPPASISWVHPDYRNAFVQGTVAMTNEFGATVLLAAEQNPAVLDNIGVFPFPGPDSDDGPAAAVGGGYYYGVGKAPAAEEAASKALLSCMYDPTLVADRANSRPIFAMPATQSAFESDTYQDNEYVQRFATEIELIRTEVLQPWYRYGLEAGLNPIAGQIASTDIVPKAVQAAALGTLSPEDAVRQIDVQLRDLVAQLGSR
ncbi:MAG: extracellular solute-binding protein [Microbacteriaceae bacterium]|nr:extracellular solute-binding protein [Microbacteriaceae bacterium]